MEMGIKTDSEVGVSTNSTSTDTSRGFIIMEAHMKIPMCADKSLSRRIYCKCVVNNHVGIITMSGLLDNEKVFFNAHVTEIKNCKNYGHVKGNMMIMRYGDNKPERATIVLKWVCLDTYMKLGFTVIDSSGALADEQEASKCDGKSYVNTGG